MLTYTVGSGMIMIDALGENQKYIHRKHCCSLANKIRSWDCMKSAISFGSFVALAAEQMHIKTQGSVNRNWSVLMPPKLT